MGQHYPSVWPFEPAKQLFQTNDLHDVCGLTISLNKLNDPGNHKKAAYIIYMSKFEDVNHLSSPCQKMKLLLNILRILWVWIIS